MLKKENRLKKQKDFENVFQNGKSFKEGGLYFKIKENNLGFPRFGFVVSKKNFPKAIERNKIKRILREAIKKEELKKNIDVIIVVNPERDIDNLKNDLKKFLEKNK